MVDFLTICLSFHAVTHGFIITILGVRFIRFTPVY